VAIIEVTVTMKLYQYQRIMDMGRAMFMVIVMFAGHVEEYSINVEGRDWWVFPKQQTEWDVIQGKGWMMSPALLNQKWVENYRMSYMTFEELVEELRPYIEHQNTR
jgi:hypothetical protein